MTKELRILYEELNTKKAAIEGLMAQDKITEANALMPAYKELKAAAEDLEKKDEEARNNMPTEHTKTPYNDRLKIYNSQDKISSQYKGEEKLSLGNYIKGAITGNWNGADKEREEFKALSTTGGNILIPKTLSSTVIDLARNKSIIFGKVPTVTMDSNNLTIGKVVSDPVFGFKEELVSANPSEMAFEGVVLHSKMVYGLMKLSLEVLHSAQNLDSLVTNAMAQAIAVAVDSKMLFGLGNTIEPKGILTYTDINSVDAAEIGYDPFISAVGKIRQANGEPTDWAINAATDTVLNTNKDSDGKYTIPPKVIADLNKSISNQLPNNLGTGTDESVSMVYDVNAILVGIQQNLSIEVSREAGFNDGSVCLRVYGLMDVAVTNPKFITKINKLK